MKNRGGLIAALIAVLVIAGIGCGSGITTKRNQQTCKDRGGVVVKTGPKGAWHCAER